MNENEKAGKFTAEERAAMKQRAKELKANSSKEEAAKEVLDKIAAMTETDGALALRLHVIVTEAAPELDPKLYYGMPAYAKDGKIVCFFQDAAKFKTRYSTFGFNDSANIDDGTMWPTSFAITTLSLADEKKIAALVRKAVR